MSQNLPRPIAQGVESEIIIYQDHTGAVRTIAGILPHKEIAEGVFSVATVIGINADGELVREESHIVRDENVLARSHSTALRFALVA